MNTALAVKKKEKTKGQTGSDTNAADHASAKNELGAAAGMPLFTSAQFIGVGAIRAKLNVSQPNDPYEQEADRVADQVMRIGEPHVQMKST